MELNIVCIETNNYLGRGEEYVEKLRAQIKKHLTVPYEFHVISDNPRHATIEAQLPGWWEKIRLFQLGIFPLGELVIYFDLDTFITGNIDHLADINGAFATLKDFMRPHGIGPGVIIWRSGFLHGVWEDYKKAGKPIDHAFGDQWWLESFRNGVLTLPPKLQELYPQEFVSYKVHCQGGLPKAAKIVCFHGEPRPHEAQGWAKEYWETIK